MQIRVPLAIFTYNRPMHTRRLLDSLDRNGRLGDVDVWVFSDSPKRPEHAAGVEETRDIVRKWSVGIGARVCERDVNLGIARSIVGAVNELINEYGSVIVLEDDLVVAPDFLHFMLEGLRRYANCPRVMQISGHLHTDVGRAPTSGLFLPLTTSWGWATWALAWRQLKLGDEISAFELERDPSLRRRLTVDGACPFFEQLLQNCLEQPGEIWDIFWWFAVAKADGLVLHPNRTLVWNGGFDGTGVHCGNLPSISSPDSPLFADPQLDPELTWPKLIEADKPTFAGIRNHLALMYGTASLRSRLLARISNARTWFH